MPKIVIKEYDKTTVPPSEYINFSVVIPGPVNEKSNLTNFDANGIREFSSQEDFDNEVGSIAATGIEAQKANAPVVEEEGIYATNYIKKDAKGADIVEDDKPVYDEALFATDVAKGLYTRVLNTKSSPVGKLVSTGHIYTKLKIGATLDPKTEYIKLKSEGNDAVKVQAHGNQIAHELLGLGYTVLYKGFYETAATTEKVAAVYKEKNIKSVKELGTEEWWQCLKDKSEYDFRYIMTGIYDRGDLTAETDYNSRIIEVADFENAAGRGDCVALVDLDISTYKDTSQLDALKNISTKLSEIPTSSYAAIFAPTVTYKMPSNSYNNKTFPGSFHYLACAARAQENYSEWYATAGYSRGISRYTIDRVGCTFGEEAINILEARNQFVYTKTESLIDKAVNLIVKIKNNYYLWGNRTAAQLEVNSAEKPGDLTAKHFLNIRQLCTTIKKQVYVACRRFTFEPNSDMLWLDFCNAIRPTLEKMKADQGIADYKLVKVKSSKKALLTAKIRIVPIEAVEDFEISLFLEDSLNGTVIGE